MVTRNLYAFSGGIWRNISDPWVNVSGWRQVQRVYAFQSGAWRLVYQRAFIFDASNGGTIAADARDWNLASKAAIAGWNGTDIMFASITVNPGVYVGSTITFGAALTIPVLPAGSTVSLTNNGAILGRGGNGGIGDTGSGSTPGDQGGLAFSIAYATTVVNNGIIGGGGGGGGGGGWDPGGPEYGGGGGGGQGYDGGAGGVGTDDGSAGTKTAAGLGALSTGGYAGDGGTLGVAGAHAQPATVPGSAGGAPGAATSGYSNVISWTGSGTTYGAIG